MILCEKLQFSHLWSHLDGLAKRVAELRQELQRTSYGEASAKRCSPEQIESTGESLWLESGCEQTCRFCNLSRACKDRVREQLFGTKCRRQSGDTYAMHALKISCTRRRQPAVMVCFSMLKASSSRCHVVYCFDARPSQHRNVRRSETTPATSVKPSLPAQSQGALRNLSKLLQAPICSAMMFSEEQSRVSTSCSAPCG